MPSGGQFCIWTACRVCALRNVWYVTVRFHMNVRFLICIFPQRQWMDGYLVTHTERLSAGSVPRMVIAPYSGKLRSGYIFKLKQGPGDRCHGAWHHSESHDGRPRRMLPASAVRLGMDGCTAIGPQQRWTPKQ